MDEEEAAQIEEIVTKNETERTPPRVGQNTDHEIFCENHTPGKNSVEIVNEDTSKTNDCDQNETEISEEISEIYYKRSSVRKPWRSPTLENEPRVTEVSEVVPSPENSLNSDLDIQLEEKNFQETQDDINHTLNNNNNESHPSAPEIDLIADLLGTSRVTQESLFLKSYSDYSEVIIDSLIKSSHMLISEIYI